MCCLALPHTGLPQTKLGCYLETRVNDFLKRQNHPESGEVTIRVVHVSDKVVEVKPGMKSRYKNRTWTLSDINKKKCFSSYHALEIPVWFAYSCIGASNK